MLHHLVPEEVEPGSLRPNLSFYEARTAHGSSLSPAIHAALLARAASQIVHSCRFAWLPDSTSTISPAPPPAAFTSPRWEGSGKRWRTGSAGSVPGATLNIDPQLPSEWSALTLHLMFHGAPVVIRAEHDGVVIDCAVPLTVRIGGALRNRVSRRDRAFTTADRHHRSEGGHDEDRACRPRHQPERRGGLGHGVASLASSPVPPSRPSTCGTARPSRRSGSLRRPGSPARARRSRPESLLAAVGEAVSMPPCSEHGRLRAVAAEQSAAPHSTCSS